MQERADLIFECAGRLSSFTGPGSKGEHKVIAENLSLSGRTAHFFTRVMREDAVMVIGCTVHKVKVCVLDIEKVRPAFPIGKIEKTLLRKSLLLLKVECDARQKTSKVHT